MSYSIVSDPPVVDTLTLASKQPFDISFGTTYTTSTYTIQFTDSTPALLAATSSNRFVSSVGFTGTGNAGTLIVDAISTNPQTVQTLVPKIYPNSSMAATAVDSNSGAIYFADTNNHTIYISDSNGNYSLFAGTGSAGYTNGGRLSATFNFPLSLAVGNDGSVYVGDLWTVRKIDTTGIVTTLAGSNAPGSVNGTGSAARFLYPIGLTVDSNDDIYVADSDNQAIRKVTQAGVVTTYAGLIGSGGFVDGTLAAARFLFPRQLSLDVAGAIYVADYFNNRIRKIESGNVSTVVSNVTRPFAVTVDTSINVYYAKEDETIFKVSNGTSTLIAGTSGVRGTTNGLASNATFWGINNLSVLGSNIYLPEIYNGDIRVLNLGAPDARPSGTRPAGYTIVATSNVNVQVTPRIDASSTAIGGVIQLYAYEPFTNTFTANLVTDTLRFTNSAAELISFLSNPTPSQVTFSSTTGFGKGYSTSLTLLVEDLCGSTVMETISNTVRIGSGRFFPPAQNSLYSFYLNEPITPQPFTATIPLQTPIIAPTLPIGLSLVRTASNSFDMTGTPTVQLVSSNYKVIGKGSADPTKIVTVDVNIRVGAERLVMDVCGLTSIPLAAGTAIEPSVITSRAPPYPLTGNNIRYTWSNIPDGLYFTDVNGNVKTSGYLATDASSTLVLTGTPTTAAASNAASSIVSTTVTATRVSTPNITSNVSLSFSFGEQVLFQPTNVQSTFYVGAPVSATSTFNSFSAYTRFATIDASITDIWSPDLLSDLSLAFLSNEQRAILTGTPLSINSGTFSVYASNANGATGSTGPFTFSIVNDTISFVSPTPSSLDTCLNYILGRSASNAKTGYYTAPIEFRAVAASGCNLVLLAEDLSGTGLALSNNIISGIPTTVTPLTTLTVDASSLVTTATNSTSILFEILPDTFYFPSVSFTFIQNRQITPYRFDVSTNSERRVIGYSSPDLPSGLSLSAVGRLTGTPTGNTSGTFTVVASTGYTNGSNVFSYTMIPDAMLLFTDPLTYTYSVGSPVDVKVVGLTFSGKVVSNYAFSGLTPTYGMSINSVSGNISGTLTGPLPASCNFSVTASAGLLNGSLGATLSSGTPTLTFAGLSAGTATFTSPAQTSFVFYQYMQITPIQLDAIGTGQVYYFIETADLPIGLSFDPTTRIISGAPMRLGENTIHIYAQDTTGVTRLVLYTNTIIPRIVRNQTSAGGYTSLIRQYTEVNAAQNARDRRVLPAESKKLGEFQSPYKPDAVSADNCFKC